MDWKAKSSASYNASVIVKANDRTGISVDIIKLLQDMKIKLSGFTAKATEDKTCIINVSVEITSVEELQKIMKQIKKIESVYDVKRAK